MDKTFSGEELKEIDSFVEMSRTVGSSPDIIQAGGGNTSVKIGDIMAVKCSGSRLKDMTATSGYVCLPYKSVRKVYQESSRGADAEKAASEAVNSMVIPFKGLPTVHPSVEAGMHSLLKTYAIHSHAVYANVFNCCEHGDTMVSLLLRSEGIDCMSLPFVNPSADLAFALLDAELPQVIFLGNHGLIVHADTADEALELNDAVIYALRKGINGAGVYPETKICQESDGYRSASKPIVQAVKDGWLTREFVLNNPLYPDQLAYLNTKLLSGAITIGDGVYYNTTDTAAAELDETLLAFVVVVDLIRKNGFTLKTMPESGVRFITGWDAEKYRVSRMK